MDCPACGYDKSKVLSTIRWPMSDTRKQECCRCKHIFQSIAMPIEMMALLETCALASRKYLEARDAYDPESDPLKKYEGMINSSSASRKTVGV